MQQHHWESGPLGYPTSGPIDINIPLNQMQTFQGGDNYYNPLTGGAVWGDIKQRYDQMGGSHHPIGIPITNEQANGDRYLYNNFSNGTISWRNDRQTRFMYLATQKVWDALGRETGQLGFPESDETTKVPGVFHLIDFAERGVIAWNNVVGARELHGDTYALWLEKQDTAEDLGWPIPALSALADSAVQRFTKGSILGTGDSIAWVPADEETALEDFLPIISEAIPGSSSSNTLQTMRATTKCAPLGSVEDQKKTEKRLVTMGGPVKKENQRKLPSNFRFAIRQGYYDSSEDEGYGYNKAYCKHYFFNPTMMEAVVNESAVGYGSNNNYFNFKRKVYFLDCGAFAFKNKNGCEEAHAPEVITVIFDPYKIKGDSGASFRYPNGLITAWCDPPGANLSEPHVSECPAHANQWTRLA